MNSPDRLPVVLWIAAALCCALGSDTLSAAEPTVAPEQVEFFEQQVRPLLVEKCWSCHGPQKQQGGLRLDSRAAALKGNETGQAIDLANRPHSRLLQVLAYSQDDIQMPPQGKLPAEQIAALTKWVELGAPWPERKPSDADPHGGANVAGHWAFQPMRRVELPLAVSGIPSAEAANERSARLVPRTASGAIDAFILQRLQEHNLTLAPPADRATFIRRATFDLWGLPPTYADVQEFMHDTHPDAVERLIDRLLASPRYGERWARYWLDIARYADTKGYVFTAEPRYPYAYTYRDYVIDAFNADKPYDRFVTEQLAADQLGLGDNNPTLAALGFITVGRRFLNKTEDIIDDRIDVVCRGLMSLTVGCARCHDHKFDPVPTADYYSLYGVFASCTEPDDLPVIGEPAQAGEYEKYLAELKQREQTLSDFDQKTRDDISREAREKVAAYLDAALSAPRNSRDAQRSQTNGEPRFAIVRRWQDYLAQRAKQPDPVFQPWHQWIEKTGDEFAKAVQEWCRVAEQPGRFDSGDERINLLVRQALIEHQPTTPAELAKVYGNLLAETHRRWEAWSKDHSDAKSLPDVNAEELRLVLYGAGTPTVITADDSKSRGIYNRAERDKRSNLQKQIEAWQASSPGAPPRAMIVRDQPQPMQPHVFIRGNSGRPGPQVPRQFIEVVAGPERKPFANGSGRLELAQSIIHPQNPLTARVIVNRVWQHHFGKGLVRTPGDFGIRGEPPTHPELLDHLALRLIESSWSLKELHRGIMTSAVYGQASKSGVPASAGLPVAESGLAEARIPTGGTPAMIDPENRLLWQFPRQRLDLEAMRDAWLSAAGALDERLGGRPFDSISDPQQHRRTVYGLVNRNDLPGVFRVFDFADPDASAPERPQTTVPQQALFAMNSPFIREQAHRVVERLPGGTDDSERVVELYRGVLSRDPDSIEREQALQFVKSAPTDGKQSPWERLAQVLLLTNEFAFVD